MQYGPALLFSFMKVPGHWTTIPQTSLSYMMWMKKRSFDSPILSQIFYEAVGDDNTV